MSQSRGVMAAVNIHQEFLQLQSMLRSESFHRQPIRKCLSLANRLLNLYIGLAAGEVLRINELKLRCMATLFYHQEEDSKDAINVSQLRIMMDLIKTILSKNSQLAADKFTATLLRECRNVNRESLFHALLGGLINDNDFGKVELSTIGSQHIDQITAKINTPLDGAVFKWVICIGHRVNFKGNGLLKWKNQDSQDISKSRKGVQF